MSRAKFVPVCTGLKKGSKKVVIKIAVKWGKKRRKTRKESYAIYIYKVMKQVHPAGFLHIFTIGGVWGGGGGTAPPDQSQSILSDL